MMFLQHAENRDAVSHFLATVTVALFSAMADTISVILTVALQVYRPLCDVRRMLKLSHRLEPEEIFNGVPPPCLLHVILG